MATIRYVRPSSRGWEIVREGHRRATAVKATKREAIAEARRLVRNEGGGEIRIMNRIGKLTDADTVAASKARPRRRVRRRAAARV